MTLTIQVWGDWRDDSTPFLIGSMFVDSVRGKESLAFAFNKGWLQSPDALTLDPHLQLFEGY
jgi:serine/threonine-protein kinase HipA